MINYIRKKNKQWFYFIPLKLPIIIFAIIIICIVSYFCFGKADGLFINLITELIGIVITVYIVSFFLYKEEKKEWDSVSNILYGKYTSYIHWFFRSISEILKVNLAKEFGAIAYLTAELDIKKMNVLINSNLENSINDFKPNNLDEFIKEISDEKENLSSIIHYMEKFPFFLHTIQFYEIESKLDKIISAYWAYKITKNFKEDELIKNSQPSYALNLITELKAIFNLLIEVNDNLKDKMKSKK